ncbi:MAG: WbqC family protein [Bacteroidota bacterium]
MSKKVAVLQSNYIPWKGYFDIINSVDEFIFYDEVQFTKNDWRNRNKIKTQNGVQWITIPVRQESLDQKICDVKVSLPNWAEKHWRTLITNYSKAPGFALFRQPFEEFYKGIKTDLLSEINQQAIRFINNVLNINTRISSSKDYSLIEGKNERLVDLICQAGGTEYISGPAARSYIDENMFREAGIKLSWMDYSGYSEYNQMFPPFEHGVSVVDLLFNEGGNASRFMKSFSNMEQPGITN